VGIPQPAKAGVPTPESTIVVQVLANGGAAVLLAIASAALPSGERLFFAAFIGALATVTADTWATELGLLSKEPPRLITTWQSAHKGESGAVSPLRWP